ncbi:hypothetical protein C8F04DRAFT_1356929 [Mycena alexandri]|uniref:Restriction of telomere capping protein 4 C-terminal domain-containing protein n=1 Tax=Mycena alexandri TaxID=1745969 RepID=A0AAD6TDZ8_9AGAR|nr:hypothetical protein C8F04DRAFT_1356929 [Mycena alexandri]
MAPSKALRNAAETTHMLQEKLAAAEAQLSRELVSRKVQEARSSAPNSYHPQEPHTAPKKDSQAVTTILLQRIVKDMVHQELNVSTTISKQEKTRLEATIIKIGKIAPYFRRFAGSWPVHDMIRTYLLNMQTRRRKDLADEKEWMEASVDGVDTAEEGGDIDADADEEAEQAEEAVDTDDEEKVVNDDTGEQSAEEDEEGENGEGENDEDEYCDDEEKEIVIPPKKTKASSGKSLSAATSVQRGLYTQPLPYADISATEEEEGGRFTGRCASSEENLRFKVGSQGSGVSILNLEICAAITEENKKDGYLRLGARNQWPVDIDFSATVPRILELKELMLDMFRSQQTLQNSLVFQHFLTNIGYKLFRLAISQSKARFNNAVLGRRCGNELDHVSCNKLPLTSSSYGPKGDFVITSTIYRMLSTEDEQLETDLCSTRSAIISEDPDVFDGYDASSNLISIKDFVSFILTPYIASLLISEDQDIDLEEATKVLAQRNDFGDLLQREDDNDPATDTIHRTNIRAMKGGNNHFFAQAFPFTKPPKKQKAERPQGLSLMDFDEVSVKTYSNLTTVNAVDLVVMGKFGSVHTP